MTTAVLLLTFLPLASAPGGVVSFRGPAGGVGDVVVVDPSGAQPPATPAGLAGITLLPLDVNGRVELDALRGDRARLALDIPGAARLRLPAGVGSLYRFSRPDTLGARFGLFLVDAAGEARVVFELPGTGPAADQPSFLPRLAVAPDGAAVLVATRESAGGNLLEVDLASGVALDRTAALPPQRFAGASLHLAASWGIAATQAGLWRFDRGTSGDVEPVPMPGSVPVWFSGEVVLSRNGAWALTTAGAAEDQAFPFAFAAVGAARQVSTAAQWISPAGFQPEHRHGPYLAISDDGTRAAWRTEGLLAREAWLAEVPQAGTSPSQWLTSDANYIDTIDEIGQFAFKPASAVLVYAAGERSTTGPPVIENIDFYQAQLPTGGAAPALLNITQSSGIALPPFLLPAALDPSFVNADPTGTSLLFHSESSGGSGDLLAATPGQAGFTVLLPNVKDVEFVERAGVHVFVNLRRSFGSNARELHRFSAPFAPSSGSLLTVPGVHTFERGAGRADGWFAFVETTLTKERLWRFDPLAQSLGKLNDRQLFYGPSLSWSAAGPLAFTVSTSTGGSAIHATWPTTGAVQRLPLPVGPGFVLP